jgi:hypothetical protein
VIGFLRFFGVANAAIWFGTAIFFTFAVGPAFFSDRMLALLGSGTNPEVARAYAGAAVQVVIERYFLFHLVCGLIALVHLVAEFLYMGKPLQRLTLYLLLGVFTLGVVGGYWLQPKLQHLHREMYLKTSTPQQVQVATRSFRTWHAVSQVLNLAVTAGILVYLWRVTTPASGYRYRA